MPRFFVLCLLVALVAPASAARRSDAALRRALEAFRASDGFPGAVASVYFADGTSLTVAVGVSDRETKRPMRTTDLMHGGSTGKTFFAALVLQLVAEGKIGLDEKVSRYLGREAWFSTIPNASELTIRMLLNHTSGIPPFGEAFMRALFSAPGTPRTQLDAVKSTAGAKPAGAPGAVFSYSDVNYQLLALVCERVTGRSATAEIRRRLLVPLELGRVVPADRQRIPGLVQGYDDPKGPFGERMLVRGALVLHPRFEGGGGGFVLNAADLARWMAYFGEGRAFDARLMPRVLETVPAPQLGEGARSGLGVEIEDTPLGPAYGHGGFFPGYLSQVRWYPRERIAVAIQVNTSDPSLVKRSLTDVLDELARAALEDAPPNRPARYRRGG